MSQLKRIFSLPGGKPQAYRAGMWVLCGLLGACAPDSGDAVNEVSPAAATPGPALWSVADSDTTVYLFGTFHALKSDVHWLDGKIRDAFVQSSQIALEATDLQDAPRMQRWVMQYGVDPQGRPLSTVLPSPVLAKLQAVVTSLGVPLQVLEPMEPWMAVTTLTAMQIVALGYEPSLGVDVTLQARASEAGKALTDLEGARVQLAMLDALPVATQIDWLRQTLDTWDQAASTLDTLAQKWLSGDVESIAREMADAMDEIPGLADTLLRERNAKFATWIVDRMGAPGVVFFAVGAGHLAGADSVQQHLREAGFTVTRH